MRKYSISLIAIFIAALITSYIICARTTWSSSFEMSSMYSTIDVPEEDTAFGGLFYDPFINDSLPHYIYERIKDSVKRIKDQIILTNKSSSFGVSYGAFGFESAEKRPIFGPRPIERQDSLLKLMDDSVQRIYTMFPGNTYDDSVKRANYIAELSWRYNLRVNKLSQEDRTKAERVYFLTLNGYSTDFENKFFIQDEKFYLAVVKWDSVRKRTYDSINVGHYVRKEIPVRYSAEDKKIQIPLSKKKYDLLNSLFTILFYVFLFGMIFIFFGLPVQILINISRGNAFTKRNIKRLNIMALVLFVYASLTMLAPYMIKFIFRKLIPEELRLESFSSRIEANLYLFLIAIVLFIIGKAFQKGYNLQEEEDLTV